MLHTFQDVLVLLIFRHLNGIVSMSCRSYMMVHAQNSVHRFCLITILQHWKYHSARPGAVAKDSPSLGADTLVQCHTTDPNATQNAAGERTNNVRKMGHYVCTTIWITKFLVPAWVVSETWTTRRLNLLNIDSQARWLRALHQHETRLWVTGLW